MNKKLLIGAVGLTAGIVGYIYERCHSKEVTSKGSDFLLRTGVPETDPHTPLGCDQIFNIDKSRRVSVLITGAGSYIGSSFSDYCIEHYPNIRCETLDMCSPSWREHPFTHPTTDDKVDGADETGAGGDEGKEMPYDCVFHVAGIAHCDVSKTSSEMIENYYAVNTDLAIEAARKAKESGCSQFVFMSSMIVYGGQQFIDRHSVPSPSNFYGDSKWQADKGVRSLVSSVSSDEHRRDEKVEMGGQESKMDKEFVVAVLRPPMIYGKNSKGNYPTLSCLVKHTHFFPMVENKRSMLYIDNLCEFLSLLMMSGAGGMYFPQNREYSNTSDLVRLIGEAVDHRVRLSGALRPAVWVASHLPMGGIRNLAAKAFGSSFYDQELSDYKGLDYQVVSLEESIRRTEEQAES